MAHGHTKSEAQYADQVARRMASNAVCFSDAASPANNQLPLLTYTDFERVWTSDFSTALTAKNFARAV